MNCTRGSPALKWRYYLQHPGGGRVSLDGVAARGLVNGRSRDAVVGGWSRNSFRRNQAKLTLPLSQSSVEGKGAGGLCYVMDPEYVGAVLKGLQVEYLRLCERFFRRYTEKLVYHAFA